MALCLQAATSPAESPLAVGLAGEALAALDRRLRDSVMTTLQDLAAEAGAAADRFDGFARSLATFRQDLLVGSLHFTSYR